MKPLTNEEIEELAIKVLDLRVHFRSTAWYVPKEYEWRVLEGEVTPIYVYNFKPTTTHFNQIKEAFVEWSEERGFSILFQCSSETDGYADSGIE